MFANDWPYRSEQEAEMKEKTKVKEEEIPGRRSVETKVKNEDFPGRRLVDLVLSWSIKDVLDKLLYKNQVCPPGSSHPPPHRKNLSCYTCRLWSCEYTFRKIGYYLLERLDPFLFILTRK